MSLPGIFCEKSTQVKDGDYLIAPFKAMKQVSEEEYNSMCAMSLEERLRLVETLREGVTQLLDEGYSDDESLLDTMLVLGQLEQGEAFPFFLALTKVPEDVLEEEFGDNFQFEDLPPLLSSTAHGRWDELKLTIEEVEPEGNVAALLDAARFMVLEGQIPREPVISFIKGYLVRAIHERIEENENLDYWVLVAKDLWPGECLEEIRQLYGMRLIDTDLINLETVLRSYEKGVEGICNNRGKQPFVVIENEERSVKEKEVYDKALEGMALFIDKLKKVNSKTERLLLPEEQLGRNDPCSCGSGKKFKRCCFDKEREQQGLPRLESFRVTFKLGEADFQHEPVENSVEIKDIADHPEVYLEHLLQQIQKHPLSPTPYNHLYLCYFQLGRRWDAHDLLLKTVRLFPDYLFSLVELADYYIRRGEYPKAFEVLKKSHTVKQLYPEREIFHISEVMAFHYTIGMYSIKTKMFPQAKMHLSLLEKFKKDSLRAKALRNEIFAHMQRDSR